MKNETVREYLAEWRRASADALRDRFARGQVDGEIAAEADVEALVVFLQQSDQRPLPAGARRRLACATRGCRRTRDRGLGCAGSPKAPLKPKHIWAIRQQLKTSGRRRDLALFKLRAPNSAPVTSFG